MSEKFSNNAQTTTTGSINNTSDPVTFGVTSATAFPSSGNFRVIIDNEILLVTSVSGSNFTATRAQEGTSIASHSSGANVTQVITSQGLKNILADCILEGAFSSRPTAGQNGRLYVPNDGLVIARDTGTVWKSIGPAYEFEVPDSSGWTWVNQGSYGAATQERDTVLYGDTGGQLTTDEYRILYQPIGTPSIDWTYTVAFTPMMYDNGSGSWCGINVYNSSTDKAFLFSLQFDSSGPTVFVVYTGTANGVVSTPASKSLKGITNPLWFRITKDSTNYTFYVSKDGHYYRLIYQVAVSGSYVGTANKVGLHMNNFNTSAGQASYMRIFQAKLEN